MINKLIFFLLTLFGLFVTAQTVSCNDLVRYAKSKVNNPFTVNTVGSSLLAKVEYYPVDYNSGLLIAYIKQNDYDYVGMPYIYCGINSRRWNEFKFEGIVKSWGEAFHKYIKDYTCDCN